METTRPSSPPSRHWRLSLPVSLGVVLVPASLLIAALALRSHAGDGSSHPTPASSPPAGAQRWMCLGKVDVAGGVTHVYPVQPGRVHSVEAAENEPVKAGAPLFRLEDTIPTLKVRQAEDALKAAHDRLAIAEATVKEAEQQIAAQQEAVSAARTDVERARNQYNQEKNWADKGVNGDKTAVKNAELLMNMAESKVKGEQFKLAAFQATKQRAEGAVALAKTDIAAKEAQVEEARNAVNECVVRAPVDGTPLRINVTPGTVLGTNPHQPAVEFAADRDLLVRAEVEQEFVPRVRKDQAVIIEDHVTGQEVARGHVVSIARWYAPARSASSQVVSVGSDVRTLECIVKIDSTSQEVRIGQRVRVQFPE